MRRGRRSYGVSSVQTVKLTRVMGPKELLRAYLIGWERPMRRTRSRPGVISTQENSNYGRVLTTFEERSLGAIDRKTTVVILGDGRTNYQDDAATVLDRIRARARALLWLCPESRAESTEMTGVERTPISTAMFRSGMLEAGIVGPREACQTGSPAASASNA